MNYKALSVMALVGLACACWYACSGNADPSVDIPEGRISFNYQVRPILSDKCFTCHGPDVNKREAGLRLDIQDSAFAPLRESPGAFAIVPGDPESSELIRRVSSTDPSYQMPTPGSHLGTLSPGEISILTSWIRQGARYEKHWAFLPPVKQPLPKTGNKDWARNEIDHFILAKLQSLQLEPNNTATSEQLLKRISIDLTGLLPDKAAMDAFEKDHSDAAYEKMIDKFLSSASFGEKMALHWLDISRYSDSYGYQDDNIRSQWPYRDWLIHAFNSNMPYDRFLTWQLAGDLLPQASKEQVLATAFLRNHKYTEEGGVIPEEYRVEYVVDKVKTYSKGLLAMTAECAQCHDHKYDPISQKDYFSLYAFFNNSKEQGFEGDVSVSKPAKTPVLSISDDDVRNMMQFINKQHPDTVQVSVMGELDTLRPTYLLNRGLYDQPGERVEASSLPAVMKFDTARYAPNRLGLAQWTVDKSNPLTARVFVNHLWQEIFGKGIVKTSGDFGMQGELPSHPELLDWLAVDFMEHDWNIKYLVKKILLSATYRQSAAVSPAQLRIDPDNIYLSRAPRLRVKAEIVRDIVLGSSGLLNRTLGGPSVKPYQPKGLWEAASSGRGVLVNYKQDRDSNLYRRGMYTFIKLTVPPPSLMIFDASNRDQCEVKRAVTSTPLQALVMLNDPMVLEASRVFAQQLVLQQRDSLDRIRQAFRQVLCRQPSKKELALLEAYYAEQLQLFRQGKLKWDELLSIGDNPRQPAADARETAALMQVIATIYNLEEAITKN